MSAELHLPEDHRLVRLESVDSTNAEAMRRALAGECGPLWVVSDTQTSGRGRSGRSWGSEPGNLFASLLVTLPLRAAATAYQLSLVTGVAVADAIRECGCLAPAAPLRLKWPNDILIGMEKVGGILVESTSSAGGLKAVIGIGLNIVSHPDGTAVPATHLARHGAAPPRDLLLTCVARAVAAWLARWQDGDGFAEVRAAWLDRAGPIGEPCSVNTGQGPAQVRFAGLDEDGALFILGANGVTRRYTYGDVTLSP